jgi:hypothetical protein
MTLPIRLMLRWAFFALPFQIRQCRRSTSATIVAFAFTRSGSLIDKFAAASFRVLQTHRDMKPVQNRRFRYARVGQNRTQTRTTVSEGGHLGGVSPAHGFQGPLDQRGEVGVGSGDGAKDLAATVNRLDVADADRQMAFAVFAAA